MRNTALFLVSCLVSLLLAEGALRLVFDPIDFLRAETVADPVLNHRLPPYIAGHDELGFRNKEGLREAEILALGDSITYGIMATADKSWPAQLQAQTGREVYNASLGGYGPLHYLYMARKLLPRVKPRHVVVAVYLGNDFMDAYNLTYSNDHWAGYRAPDNADSIDATLFLLPQKPKFLGRVRDWLSQTSVLYRIMTQSALFDSLRQSEQISRFQDAFQVEHLGEPILLHPSRVQLLVETDDPRILEAMALIERALRETVSLIRDVGATPHIAIVPVKETVYLPYVADQLSDAQRTEMDALAADLDLLNRRLQTFLVAEGIAFTDLGPVMIESLKTTQVYPVTDLHPNATGYAAFARALGAALDKPSQ